MININMFVTDTPMWYASPIGPPVRITLCYNSQSSIANYEPFGNKWTFTYGGYLLMDTSGTIIIVMPTGRNDVYVPDGHGGYTPPFQVHNTLTQIAPNHFELAFPDGTVYVYEIPGGTSSQQPFLTAIRDAYGQTLALAYDPGVNLTTITDASGNAFKLTYSSAGLVTNVADPFGRNAVFDYDANNNLVQITDMGGYSSSLSYDTNVFISGIADARGTYQFLTEPADGDASVNADNYPQPGTPMYENYRLTVTDPLANKQEFFYYGGCDIDAYGNCGGYSWYVSPNAYIPWQSQDINNYRSEAPKTRYLPVYVDSGQQGKVAEIVYPEGDTVSYGYDPLTGDQTSITDGDGNTWHYAYNSMGLLTAVTNATGTSTTFSYAANAVDLLAISNGLGVISMTYNSHHSILSVSDRLSNVTTFAYNSFGHALYQVDALRITNQYTYDAGNRLSSLSRSGHTLANITYDSVGRVRTATDTTGFSLTYDYNNLSQFVRVTYPDGQFDSYVYSTCCPHIIDSATGRNGLTVNFTYDALKRLTQIRNPEGGLTQFNYDANGNRSALIDPNGNATKYQYDLDNRISSKAYAAGNALSYRYDEAGFLTNRINGRGISTTYTYDPNHSLLTTSYSDGTPAAGYAYDIFNRPVQRVDAMGATRYDYDVNSRLLSVSGPWPSAAITYAYDALGRRTNLTAQLGQPVGYVYDALNRLAQVRTSSGSYAYGYSGASPLVQTLSRPNGTYTTNAYDSLNRLTLTSNQSSNGIINQFAYTYNAQDLCDSETLSNGFALTYSTNELVTYKYNNLNQFVNSTTAAQWFAYDADGNMTRGYTPDGYVWTANYDAENRLTLLVYTNGAGVICSNAYGYCANSFLAQKKQFANGVLSNDTRFVRAGDLPLQERDAANNLSREYAWGLSKGGGIGGLLTLSQGAGAYSYLYDGKGNVAAVLDASGATAATYGYDAFGGQTEELSTFEQPFGFSTKPYEQETGLVYFGYRYYMPQVGAWVSRDPLGEIPGSAVSASGSLRGYGGYYPPVGFFWPASAERARLSLELYDNVNLYNYALNSPPNFVDPKGKILIALLPYLGYIAVVALVAYATVAILGPGQTGEMESTGADEGAKEIQDTSGEPPNGGACGPP